MVINTSVINTSVINTPVSSRRQQKSWKIPAFLNNSPGSNRYVNLFNLRIPRWQLEGGSRKPAFYSEILERHRRHTLQA
jgi:hypothetical protein